MKLTKKRIYGLVLMATVAVTWSDTGLAKGEAPPSVGGSDGFEVQSRQGAGGDECCSDPGQIAECWWQDAKSDGVTCLGDSDCSPHTCELDALAFGGNPSPTGEGLCRCNYDENDYEGGFGDCPGDGVCSPDGICGPSYCNGYMTCSCWGGCELKTFGNAHYETAAEYCEKELETAPHCCDGPYPGTPGTEATGYCSESVECLGGGGGGGGGDDDDDDTGGGECTDVCDDVTDCTANPCAAPQCIDNCCDYSLPDSDMFGNCVDVQTCNAGWSALGKICCCNSDDAVQGGLQDCPALPCIDEANTKCEGYVCQLDFKNIDDTCADECGATDDACHTWRCSTGMACVEYAKPEGYDCSADIPGGNPDCGLYLCEADAYGDVECVLDNIVSEKISCDGTIPDDICARRYCDQAGGCDFAKCAADDPAADYPDCAANAPNGDLCPPSGDYQSMHCYEYRCQAALDGSTKVGAACVQYDTLFEPTPDGGVREDCTADESDKLGDVVDGDISRTESITCAVNDIDMAGSDENARFDMCDVEDMSDFVYTFQSSTEKSTFGLKHTRIDVTDVDTDIEWNPILYTTKAVKTENYLSDNQCDLFPDSQFTCAVQCETISIPQPPWDCTAADVGDAVVTNGPWPLHDVPEYNAASENPDNNWDETDTGSGNTGYLMNDGFRVDNEWTSWVVVDSTVPTKPIPPGGEFRLDLTYDDHENNNCWNSSSYVPAPTIDGEQTWKERWRGSNVGYTNYICETAGPNPYVQDADGSNNCLDDDTGIQIAAGCWQGDPADLQDALDPGGAFYRVDLPEGVYKIYLDEAGMMWNAAGYLAESPPANNPYSTADFMSVVLAFWGGPASQGPCLDTLDPASNYCLGGDKGWPRERVFDLGAQGWHGWLEVSNNFPTVRGSYEVNVIKVPQAFLGFLEVFKSSGDGAGGCGCSDPIGNFPLEGYRLDMVPVDTGVRGYSVVAKNVSPSSDYWLVDPDLDTADGVLARDIDCTGDTGALSCLRTKTPKELPFAFPYAGEFFRYYCVNAGGSISFRRNATDSCGPWDYEPSSKKITGQYDNPDPTYQGYGPMLTPHYGQIVPCWKSNTTEADLWGFVDEVWMSCKSDGMGRIVTQTVPFEGTLAHVITWQGFDGRIHASPSRSTIKNSIQFQVIIRIDGRITYYYRQPQTGDAWDDIIAYNGWIIGLSGTRWKYCAQWHDTDCATEFGAGSNVYCDDEDETIPGYDDKIVYTAKNFCTYRLEQVPPSGLSLISGLSGP